MAESRTTRMAGQISPLHTENGPLSPLLRHPGPAIANVYDVLIKRQFVLKLGDGFVIQPHTLK